MTTDIGATDRSQGATIEGKGLKSGALGLMSSTVVAIASVAPAYSLASALGAVVVVAGLQSPVIMIMAFVPMLLIAYAYQELNKAIPDCGTTFTWGVKAFGAKVGWMGGWGIVAADVVVMANLAQIAGQYMFQLFGAYGLAGNSTWVTIAGVAWIVAMTAICYIGIEVSARLQYGLLGVELVMLAIFSVVALTKVWSGNGLPSSVHPSLSWFDPFKIASFSSLVKGVLVAVFIYWGWDTAVSINEETKDRERTPGRAAIVSTLVLLATYVLVSVAAEAFAGPGTKGLGLGNPGNVGDVLSGLGSAVFGSTGVGWILAKLLVLMVLSSAAASTLTTILPTARTTLSMAAYRAIPKKFATIHRQFLTPTWSTIGMGLISIAFYVLMTVLSKNVLTDTIASIGLLIAFYYGMTGFACVWYFRHDLNRSRGDLLRKGIAPALGGLILLGLFVKAVTVYWAPGYGSSSWHMSFPPHWHIGGIFLTGIGSLLAGVVLMLIYRFVAPAFFKGRTLNRDTPVLVPDE